MADKKTEPDTTEKDQKKKNEEDKDQDMVFKQCICM